MGYCLYSKRECHNQEGMEDTEYAMEWMYIELRISACSCLRLLRKELIIRRRRSNAKVCMLVYRLY